MIYNERKKFETKGHSDIINITDEVSAVIENSSLKNGIVTVHAIGSTASISTLEYEPALNDDFKDQLEEFAPMDKKTRHGNTWGDDNGSSHIRATFM